MYHLTVFSSKVSHIIWSVDNIIQFASFSSSATANAASVFLSIIIMAKKRLHHTLQCANFAFWEKKTEHHIQGACMNYIGVRSRPAHLSDAQLSN